MSVRLYWTHTFMFSIQVRGHNQWMFKSRSESPETFVVFPLKLFSLFDQNLLFYWKYFAWIKHETSEKGWRAVTGGDLFPKIYKFTESSSFFYHYSLPYGFCTNTRACTFVCTCIPFSRRLCSNFYSRKTSRIYIFISVTNGPGVEEWRGKIWDSCRNVDVS